MYFYFWCILPNYISQRFYHLYSLAVYESFMFILAIQEYNIENIDSEMSYITISDFAVVSEIYATL